MSLFIGFLTILSTAQAELSDYIADISYPIRFETDGVWVRAFYTQSGWKLLAQQGEAYTVVDLYKDGDTWVRDSDVSRLTQGRDYQDSCIKQCPNGNYLLISSASISGFNDSAYAFLFDSNFNLIAENTIAESESQYSFNDVNCECSSFIYGATFGVNSPTQYGNYFFELNNALELTQAPYQISTVTRANGGDTWSDLSTNRVIMSGFHMERENIFIEYDPELNYLTETVTVMSEPPWEDFWTQSFIRVGEVFFAATIVRSQADPSAPYELMLVVLDDQWNVLERHLVTNGGGSRPSLARNGDQILLTSDVGNSPQLIEITIGSGFDSVDPPPMGYTDPDDLFSDTGNGLNVDAKGGCSGCASTRSSPLPMSILFGFIIFGWRRCSLEQSNSSDTERMG